jgi:putative protease
LNARALVNPRPELLAPAGDWERFETALAYGADAVYLGGPELNLRARAHGLDWPELERASALAKAKGVKIFYCLNVLAQQRHLPAVHATLERLASGPELVDALIVADPGVLRLCRRLVPRIPLHLSTQANTSNAESAAFWAEQGATRVNLARELDCRAIRAMREALPGLELEIFIHGALCLALSGRCQLSAYLNQRSANLGACTHPCRYQYRHLALEEATRPGAPTWELTEDADQDYAALLAPEDLCLVKYLPWFRRLGINALKIEGRMKSAGSLAQVLDAHRTALDDLSAGRFRPAAYLAELENASTRPYGTGFFLPGGRPKRLGQGARDAGRPILGRIEEGPDSLGAETWRVAVRAVWDADQDARLLLPGLQRPLLRAKEYALENELGERLQRAHPGLPVLLRCERPELRKGFFLRA